MAEKKKERELKKANKNLDAKVCMSYDASKQS